MIVFCTIIHFVMKTLSTNKLFAKYVSQNMLGMVGMSAYIIADTFFISIAAGADGIAALNLVLPIYSVIYALGSMIGLGSATRFNIASARGDDEKQYYFSNAVLFAIIIGIVFLILAFTIPSKLLTLLGGDATIVAVGTNYTKIFMSFAAFFMLNQIFNAFVRNDGDPSLAMIATLLSTLFNIVFDYILMFPLGMGMEGAALATAFSPILGILICCLHFKKEKNTIHFKMVVPSIKRLIHSCQLGMSGFVGEMSSGVTTLVFNFLILGIAGNIGLAAYGIVANIAIVAVSLFNGLTQGSQPLFSNFYGKGEIASIGKVLKLAMVTSLVISILGLIVILVFTDPLVQIFNSENNTQMATYAYEGIRIYFVGYIFAGINLVGTGYLGATENARWSFATSILRGFVAIIVCAIVLASLFGMIGVWLAFPVAEAITAIVVVIGIIKNQRKIAKK